MDRRTMAFFCGPIPMISLFALSAPAKNEGNVKVGRLERH